MARTTPGQVQALLIDNYDVDNLPSLVPFIETATVRVDRVATMATSRGCTLTAAELELIERWLAAHFYACADRTYSSNSTLDSSASYDGQTGKALESTMYGQTALGLDPSGALAALNSRNTAGGFWMGKPKSDRIDYVDRN